MSLINNFILANKSKIENYKREQKKKAYILFL